MTFENSNEPGARPLSAFAILIRSMCLSPREAADVLNVRADTVDKWCRDKAMPPDSVMEELVALRRRQAELTESWIVSADGWFRANGDVPLVMQPISRTMAERCGVRHEAMWAGIVAPIIAKYPTQIIIDNRRVGA